MSFHRENVIWQSPDKKWNRAFYSYYPTGDDDEWDVEYTDEFNWVSMGHPNQQMALDSWDGANPGGHRSYTYSQYPGICDRLDREAIRFRDKEYKQRYGYIPFLPKEDSPMAFSQKKLCGYWMPIAGRPCSRIAGHRSAHH